MVVVVSSEKIREFSLDDNRCYGSNRPSQRAKSSKDMCNVKAFIVVFVLVIAMLLVVICACIAFPIEISNSKAEIDSLKEKIENNMTQLLDKFTEQLTTSNHTLRQQIMQQNVIRSEIHELNTTLDAATQRVIQVLDNETQLLNISIGKFVNKV